MAERKRLLRVAVGLAVLALIAIALRRLLRRDDNRPPTNEPVIVAGQGTSGEAVRLEDQSTSDPAPRPPPKPKKELTTTTEPSSGSGTDLEVSGAAWVEPTDGTCPSSHPVKAKKKSSIFHVPGGASYDRTNADRCYVDPTAAETDGFRQSKV